MIRSRSKNFRRNLFLAFAAANNGQNVAETKREWRLTNVDTRKGIAKKIAAFEASLDGLSNKDRRFRWNARLAECSIRFASAMRKISNDGRNGDKGSSLSPSFSPEFAMAVRKARMELILFRRAKQNATMTFNKNAGAGSSAAAITSPLVRCTNNLLKKETEEYLVEDNGFKKDLDEFASSLEGRPKEEQKNAMEETDPESSTRSAEGASDGRAGTRSGASISRNGG